MKFLSFMTENGPHFGAVLEGGVADLTETGIDFPGTGSTSSDSIPDNYPDTSIDDGSRE